MGSNINNKTYSFRYINRSNISNHTELLDNIIWMNIKNAGFVSVSKVLNDFILYCTSEDCNINLRMSQEACISFIKYNMCSYNILTSYQKNSGKSILHFTIDTDQFNELYFNLPMIIEPNEWVLNDTRSNGIKGGYLHNSEDIIKLKHNKGVINNVDVTMSNEYIDLINKLHKIKYNKSCIFSTLEEHNKIYEENILKLNNMKQDSDYEKKLYYMFKCEYIDPLKTLLTAYQDFTDIINRYQINNFHFLFNACFRGRIYVSGLISPTSDKILRKHITPYGYVNKNKVIEMDATASILQILATISCSIELAKITNLLTTTGINTWSWIHEQVISKTKDEQQQVIDNYFKVNKGKRFDINDIYPSIGIIDRDIVKTTIMRILYGSNPFQISKDIKKEYNLHKLSYKHILLVYATFLYHFPEEINILKIIKTINNTIIKNENRGMYIDNNFISFRNTYYKSTKEIIRFKDNNNKRREVEITLIDKTKLDIRKSNNASSPNFFHSIDSGICLSIIKTFLFNSKFILTIHDAFMVYEEDSIMITQEYNKELYRYNSKIIDLIDDVIDKVKFTKTDNEFIINYQEKLKCRRKIYRNMSSELLNSKFSLKRGYHTSKENNEIIRYEIKLSSLETSLPYFLQLLLNEIKLIPIQILVTARVQIYSFNVKYNGGYRQKVSSKVFTLDKIEDCIEEFWAKFDNYGDDLDYIPVVQTIRFSYLSDLSLKIIKEVHDKILSTTSGKPEFMDNELWYKLSSIIEHKAKDESKIVEGMSTNTYNTIKNMFNDDNSIIHSNINDSNMNDSNINDSNINDSNINDSNIINTNIENDNIVIENNTNIENSIILNKYEKRYERICRFLNKEMSKPKQEQNKRIIHNKKSLASYYVKTYNLTKRHYSSTKYIWDIEYTKIINELKNIMNNKLKTEHDKIVSKFGVDKAEYYNKLKYIPTLSNKRRKSGKNIVITADFETVVYENKHYVFCSSISYNIRKHSELECVANYINKRKLNEDLSNIKELSEDLLINFWNRLDEIVRTEYNLKDTIIVYFHNMDKFDGVFLYHIIIHLLKSQRISLDDIEFMNRNYITYQITVGRINFRDSLHVLPGSLQKLAQSFLGESKKSIDIKFDYNSITNNDVNISEYCKHDSRLLYNILMKFIESIDNMYNINPTTCITTSSLAFKILRMHYINNYQIQNTSKNQNIHRFIYDSYRGGISTVITPISHEYKLTHIDINSSYPSSMTKDLPKGLGMWITGNHRKELNSNIMEINDNGLKLFGFFDVLIKVEPCRIISPLIIKYNGKLTDVLGEIRVTLFSEELNFILKNGGILLKIKSGLVYERCKYLKDFANSLYEQRKSTTNKVEEVIYKLILNSAYGRFALKEYNEKVYLATNNEFDEVSKYREVSNDINLGDEYTLFNLHTTNDDEKVSLDDKRVEYIINNAQRVEALRGIQVASAITSYSRMLLLQQAFDIIDNGGNIYYMDTDSIYTDIDYNKLESIGNISEKLGDWKLEDRLLRGIFIQSKFYITQKKNGPVHITNIKLKGIPSSAVDEMKQNENIWKLLESRYEGNALKINVDKYFLRNIKDQSINVKKNIEYVLKENMNFKRLKVYNDENKWISTTPINIKYDTVKTIYKSYNIIDNKHRNLDTKVFNNNIKNIIDEYESYINKLLNHSRIKIPFKYSIKLNTYQLAQYELRMMLIKKCNHKVRVIFDIDNLGIASSTFTSIGEAINFVAYTEEVYQDYILNYCMIVNKIDNKSQATKVLSASLDSCISIIDRSEILINEVSDLLKEFIKHLKAENIVESLTEYYNFKYDYIIDITERLIKVFNIHYSHPALLRGILDEIIKGYDISMGLPYMIFDTETKKSNTPEI
jgi:uncharacterized protein YjbI with pentapeptide repeats